MEREILFRGKREGDWFYGDLLTGDDTAQIWYKDEGYGKVNVLVDPSTVGQYTGLTDKNGVKIFEGDILKRNNNSKDIVQVAFGKFPVIDTETESEVDEVIGWYCKVIHTDALSRIRPFCLPMPLTDYYIDRYDMEIIENIHDNPELLKGEDLK